jgi:hypothetical protein
MKNTNRYEEYDFYEMDDAEKLPLSKRLRIIFFGALAIWAFIFVAAIIAMSIVGFTL